MAWAIAFRAAGALSGVMTAGSMTITSVRAPSLIRSSLDLAPMTMSAGLPFTVVGVTTPLAPSASTVACTRAAAIAASVYVMYDTCTSGVVLVEAEADAVACDGVAPTVAVAGFP